MAENETKWRIGAYVEESTYEKIIQTTGDETHLCKHLNKIDNQLFNIRELVRSGNEVTSLIFEPSQIV